MISPMGRTLQTTNDLILKEEASFRNFKRALRQKDQVIFDQLFVYAKNHKMEISLVDHALPLESILFAICFEQQKQIDALKSKLE